jgi:hypothetical protein
VAAPRVAALAAVLALAVPPVTAGGAAPAAPHAVRITVHVPLTLNDHTPVEPSLRRAYVALLAKLGPVVEHAGRGSFVDGGKVQFEPIDHVVVVTSSPRADAVVHDVLARMRSQLAQTETLAEAAPDPSWRGEEHRVQFEVIAAPRRRSCDRCQALHAFLGAEGGGASEFADPRDGTHVISSVPRRAADRVRGTLRKMRVSFAERSSGFVVVAKP